MTGSLFHYLSPSFLPLPLGLAPFSGQRWEWSDVCVALSYKMEFQVKGWERERLGLDDIISVLQQYRLRWCEHVLRRDCDQVKKLMEYEVLSATRRGRPKKTWREIVWKDCKARKLHREDALYPNKWKKQIRDDWWPRLVWVGECFFWYWLTRVDPDKNQRAIKWLCVCCS